MHLLFLKFIFENNKSVYILLLLFREELFMIINARKLKFILLCCFTLLLINCTSVYAMAVEHDNVTFDKVEKIGNKVEQYLVVKGTYVYFNYELAEKNKESFEVIEQGLLIESISNEFNGTNGLQLRSVSISLPIWGNYCGPGYSGEDFTKPAQDILDEGCRRHDKCYKWGLSLTQNCECNRALVQYIDENKSKMTGKMAKVAWAIRTYFNTIGMIGC